MHPLWQPDELTKLEVTDIIAGSNRLFVGGILGGRKYMIYMLGISLDVPSFKQAI